MSLEAILLAAVSGLVTAVVYLYHRQEKQAAETKRELTECRRDREKLNKMVQALSRHIGHLEARGPQFSQRHSLNDELAAIEEEYTPL